MNTFKLFVLSSFAIAGYTAQAQVKVGDNPTAINSNAVFELESTNKGVLFPRMALTGTASPSPLSAFVAGMTVYNTTTAGSGTTAVSPGLYYSDGTKWVALGKDWAEDQSLGSIAVFPFASVPSTYLICNGAAISRTTYAALFAKIGTTYGAGDGSTTFNLPDLRGEFIRGWDNGRGIDTGRVLGSTQTQATARPTAGFTGTTNTAGAHTHTLTQSTAQDGTDDLNYTQDTQLGDAGVQSTRTKTTASAGDHSHTVTINGGGDSETRPRNVAMIYAIKAVESIVVGGGSSGGSGSGTTYSGSQSVTLNGTTFERAALTGDVTAASNSNATTIAPNAVTSAKIADGTIVTADLADASVTSAKIVDGSVTSADLAAGIGGIYKGSGSLSGNTTVTMAANTLAFPSTATTGTSHFTVDGTTLNVDAVANRVGVGVSNPSTALDVSGQLKIRNTTSFSGGMRFLELANASGQLRWGIGTFGTETGTANAGADFSIWNYGDSEEYIDRPFFIRRATGNVGIGTSTLGGKLHVSGDSSVSWPNAQIFSTNTGTGGHTWAFGARPQGTNGDFVVSDETDGVQRVTIQGGTGRVGIGITSPTHILHINGVGRSTSASWATTSDKRLKENIVDYTLGINELMKIKTYAYNYKAGVENMTKEEQARRRVGIMAQEIEQILPSTITTINENGLSDQRLFNADELTYLLINATKDQQREIDALKSQLAEMAAKIEQLLKK